MSQQDIQSESFMEEEAQSLPALHWWYRFVSQEWRIHKDMKFIERERVHKTCLLANILFFYFVVVIVFLPFCPFDYNPNITTFDLVLLVAGAITVVITRRGHTTAAGIFLIVVYELVIAGLIFTTYPLKSVTLQYYDISIVGLLLTVVLLPPRTVFLTAWINCILIYTSLHWMPYDPSLALDVREHFWPILITAFGIQFMAAWFSFISITTITNANSRANRATIVARLEHKIADTQREVLQDQQELKASIEELVQAHLSMSATQTDFVYRFKYTNSIVLWPLVNILNALYLRMDHQKLLESELERTQRAIMDYAEKVEQLPPHAPLPIYPTQSHLDRLIMVFARWNTQSRVYNRENQ